MPTPRPAPTSPPSWPAAATAAAGGAAKGRSAEAVLGVDGCRGGWVVAYLAAGAARPEVEVVAHFDAVAGYLERGEVGHVAVDMPIGLPDVGPRPCDVAARRLLGPRRSSVFPAPVRATLGSASFADALARSRSASGRGLPIQAYNLLGRIAEVEEAVRRVGQSRLTETHPELAFAALAGAPIAQSKRHPAGAAARRAALTAVWPTVGEVLLGRRAGCRGDDVADACALAWSADRLRRGRATILGGDPDRTGLRMEIAW